MKHDPNQWLEKLRRKGARLGRARNADALKALAESPGFTTLRDDLRAILDSDARIPTVEKIGEQYYNFWKDKAHPPACGGAPRSPNTRSPIPVGDGGTTRRAQRRREEELRLARRRLLPPASASAWSRSRAAGPSDRRNARIRPAGQGLRHGRFSTAPSQGLAELARCRQRVRVHRLRPGSMTSSGYARIVKLWRRGTPMASAKTLFEADEKDLGVWGYRDHAEGFHAISSGAASPFYNNELYLLDKDDKPQRLDLPNSADKGVHRDWLTLSAARADGQVPRRQPARHALRRLHEGQARVDGAVHADADHLAVRRRVDARLPMLNLLEDVKGSIEVLYPTPEGSGTAPACRAPKASSTSRSTRSIGHLHDYFLTATSFLTPDLAVDGRGRKVRAAAAEAAAGLLRRQRLCRHATLRHQQGRHARALLHGRGEGRRAERRQPPRSCTATAASRSARRRTTARHRPRLAQPGRRVRARQHPRRRRVRPGPGTRRALRENRLRAYEDFAAVAQDLFARKVTQPKRLGIQGGSNGGLLVGNMMVLYPQLFGAVVCQVPLLDMKRYSHLLAGASWMAEYGDPDVPADWAFIQTFSPYHLVRKDVQYPPCCSPPPRATTAVHPGHARKMAAKMIAQGHEVLSYENIEGGHGGAANNDQAAFMQALSWTFLKHKLFAAAP